MFSLKTSKIKRVDLEAHFENESNISISKTSLLYNEDVISTKEVERLIASNSFFEDERVVAIPTFMAERLQNLVQECSNKEAV